MADQTQAIAQDFQDGLHLVQREFVVGKQMFEFTNANLNEEFATATSQFQVQEGNTLVTGGFYSNDWTWYVFPFANGSSPFYTLNAVQERDVQYLRNNHYFFKTMLDFPQLLINYDTFFIGFDSGVLSTRGNNPYFKMSSKNYSATYCNCDSMGNCYYSSVCRPWYVSQKAHPEQCFFSDLYLFAGGTSFGLAITSPLKEVNGTFAGAYNTNIVPSFSPIRVQQGNYIKRMYFPDSEKSNYLISDNQPIVSNLCTRLMYIQWSPNWNVTSYSAYLQQVEDLSMKTLIQNFEVKHEFPQRHTKIAYFDWNLTKQQVLKVLTLLQCDFNAELLNLHRRFRESKQNTERLHPWCNVRIVSYRRKDCNHSAQIPQDLSCLIHGPFLEYGVLLPDMRSAILDHLHSQNIQHHQRSI
ncbi:hypothetical protein FGO68_gene15316 [Halteria grandinella]|uniref:Uncharacterized protein n=1 Tax=Halteria grandinella TaxID=5974 RepID=A0A8J8P544_HALGN|nr:hypothetical protein FGO68_gene15316 [Halteria grandinella]